MLPWKERTLSYKELYALVREEIGPELDEKVIEGKVGDINTSISEQAESISDINSNISEIENEIEDFDTQIGSIGQDVEEIKENH